MAPKNSYTDTLCPRCPDNECLVIGCPDNGDRVYKQLVLLKLTPKVYKTHVAMAIRHNMKAKIGIILAVLVIAFSRALIRLFEFEAKRITIFTNWA